MHLLLYGKIVVPLSLRRGMPIIRHAIKRFLGSQEIVADFFHTPGDACTSMTPHRVRAVCPCVKGSRYYLLLAGFDSSVLFLIKRYGTSY